MEYALSTNSDLYAYNLTTEATTNLTEGMMGYDTNPAFSPDGRYMAWLSMERDGYEADKTVCLYATTLPDKNRPHIRLGLYNRRIRMESQRQKHMVYSLPPRRGTHI